MSRETADRAPAGRASRGRAVAGGVVGGLALALAAGWAGVSWWGSSLAERARRDLAENRHAEAREAFARLAAWWPGRAEYEYPLGLCEQQLGRIEAALAAWSRVPTGSPFAEDAALRRARAEVDRGRLARAEDLLTEALKRPGKRPVPLRHELLQLYWQAGRLDEARPLLERNWEHAQRTDGPDSALAIENLRAHLALDLEPYPVDRVSASLEEAGRLAPDDDRVWLGKCRLALRTGRFEEAARWLERCLSARAHDAAVWSAALDLATAQGDVDLAERALRELSAAVLPPERGLRARAWLAERRGDADAEASTLRTLLEHLPTDFAALERLAELEVRAGRLETAVELRRRKAALDETQRVYARRVSADFKADPLGLADQAERLGRRFEARGFLTLAFKLFPQTAGLRERLARLDASRPTHTPPSPEPIRQSASVEPRVRAAEPARADVSFSDDAASAGLNFRFQNGRSDSRQLPETMSGGVGVLDLDGDGWLDVYCVQGGPFPPGTLPAPAGDRLFRNRGDGTFVDVTEQAGINVRQRGYGHGVAVGDVDNDGLPDLFVTRWRSYTLLRNRGDGTFEDATERLGLGGDRDWPTSAAFADLDGDGDLDLYVCHYITWNPAAPMVCREKPGDPPSYCSPHLLPHAADHLFRNDGARFVDVTEAAGVVDPDGRGLGVVAADLDEDGKVDLFVANDGTANFLFRNLGGFRFEECAHERGVAANAEGGYQAGMGVACGDLDGDGRFDLAVTNFLGESTSLFVSLGRGQFAERTSQLGLREPTRSWLGFGTVFLDANNDGFLDLSTANGHVNDARPVHPYAMPARLALGGPGGRLTDVSARSGAAWEVPRLGRGLAAGDVDNDGRVDLVLLDQDGPLGFLHNRPAGDRPPGHFVTFRLEGTVSNRDAVGASVVVQAGGRRQAAQRIGGGSYLSAGDGRLHFGLGPAEVVEAVEVTWPSGRADAYRDLPANAGYLLREGESRALPLGGFPRPR